QPPTSSAIGVRAEPLSSKSIRIRWRAPKQTPMHPFGSVNGYYVGHRLTSGPGLTAATVEKTQFVFSTIEVGMLTPAMTGSNGRSRSNRQQHQLQQHNSS